METLKVGSLLKGGEYKIVGILGQGGFGITYEAEQTGLKRRVAVKEFFFKGSCERVFDSSEVSVPTASNRELVKKFKQKFIREAQMIAAMDHDHIVRIYDVFEENGTAYYVMEYLSGGSLSDIVKAKGALSETAAIDYIRQIADALNYLHEQNTLHLDVKPSNVLLNQKGQLKLIDFGISKHYDEAGSQTSSTPVGVSKGYAPLEQYQQGGDVSKFTPATDIYALGATLFFLVTGTVPPDASEVNEEGLPQLPKRLSANIRTSIEKAMSPRKKDRPQNINDFLTLLNKEKYKPNKEKEKDKSTKEEETTIINGAKQYSSPEPEKTCKKSTILETYIYITAILLIAGIIIHWGNYWDWEFKNYPGPFVWGFCNSLIVVFSTIILAKPQRVVDNPMWWMGVMIPFVTMNLYNYGPWEWDWKLEYWEKWLWEVPSIILIYSLIIKYSRKLGKWNMFFAAASIICAVLMTFCY